MIYRYNIDPHIGMTRSKYSKDIYVIIYMNI